MKILKSKKALSPVVAAIILIAVTVAVSIAVAAWMGALTFTFMGTEQLTFTNVEFISGNQYINITMKNTGTTPITITEIRINDGSDLLSSDVTLSANSETEQQVSYSWTNGNTYEIKVVTKKGNAFYYTKSAPSA
jgi:flagellin-like protein